MEKTTLVKKDLTPELVVKAKWNRADCKIVKVTKKYVYYQCFLIMQDRIFKDTVQTFLDCFIPITD